MDEFAILNNAKRALIALVHSIVFLFIASWQMVMSAPALGMLGVVRIAPGTWILFAIYVVVTAILLWLFVIARGWMEKTYFALCAVSAGSGMLRTIIGDHGFASGRYLRVIMLTFAVVLGLAMMRIHSQILDRRSPVVG